MKIGDSQECQGDWKVLVTSWYLGEGGGKALETSCNQRSGLEVLILGTKPEFDAFKLRVIFFPVHKLSFHDTFLW